MCFLNAISDYFDSHLYWKFIIEGYFLFILFFLVVYLCRKFKKLSRLAIIGVFLLITYLIAKICGFQAIKLVYGTVLVSYIVICCAIMAPELNKIMDYTPSSSGKNKSTLTDLRAETKELIADAVFTMADRKIGALISFEQLLSLDELSSRAIKLDAEISKELLEQIFIKDSPLHDGGVIIRGNRIVCAGAYYPLIDDDRLDKTMGSRHRAALGLSASSDAITIVVSEETGHVHITHNGNMIEQYEKKDLIKYLNIII